MAAAAVAMVVVVVVVAHPCRRVCADGARLLSLACSDAIDPFRAHPIQTRSERSHTVRQQGAQTTDTQHQEHRAHRGPHASPSKTSACAWSRSPTEHAWLDRKEPSQRGGREKRGRRVWCGVLCVFALLLHVCLSFVAHLRWLSLNLAAYPSKPLMLNVRWNSDTGSCTTDKHVTSRERKR
jgi:hypothetical protein